MIIGNRGFTLIEVMLVVAIIGVLAAIAIPVYTGYSIRTKMSEVVLALSACRTPVSEVYISGDKPPGAGNWGCEVSAPATKYVQSLSTDQHGKIIATAVGFGESSIDGEALTLMPMIGGVPAVVTTDFGKGITEFRCGEPADGTTIPAKYLPASCRGS